jgi:hypothetical protein
VKSILSFEVYIFPKWGPCHFWHLLVLMFTYCRYKCNHSTDITFEAVMAAETMNYTWILHYIAVPLNAKYLHFWYHNTNKQKKKQTNKTNSVALSPRANYTDWSTATCRRNIVSTFVDRGVSLGQHGGSPTVVNLSFLDRSRYFSFK